MSAPLPELARRDIELPPVSGKAMTVIGMRRAGKTSYLHQCRGDKLQAGAAPEQLLYFNFEDERLAGMQAGDLHLVTDSHASPPHKCPHPSDRSPPGNGSSPPSP